MKLISMTDFVLKEANQKVNKNEAVIKLAMLADKYILYAKFLKQPLKLEMFVPCDEEGNIIVDPDKYDDYAWDIAMEDLKQQGYSSGSEEEMDKLIEASEKLHKQRYQEAVEKVLFDGWVYISKWYHSHLIAKDEDGLDQINLKDFINVEHLLREIDLTLTPSAIKQLGL